MSLTEQQSIDHTNSSYDKKSTGFLLQASCPKLQLLLSESTARSPRTFMVHHYFHVLPQLSEAVTLNSS